MGMIYRKAVRDLLRSKFKFLATALVILLGSLCYIGFSSMGDIEQDYIDNYYKETNLPDVWVYYSSAGKEQLDDILREKGVKNAERRRVYDMTRKANGRESTLTMTSCSRDTEIAKPTICTGYLPEESGEAAIDVEYAQANDIRIGDTIELDWHNYSVEVLVTGLMESSEHLLKVEDSLTDIPDYKAYGIGCISEETLIDTFGEAMPYNQIVVDAKDPADGEKLADAIQKEDYDGLLYAAPRSLNGSYSLFQGRIEYCDNIAAICPVMFYLVAAVMLFIIMGNLVEGQRTQIGIMKALGIRSRTIMEHYLLIGIAVSGVGTVVGGILGGILVPEFMIYALDKQMDLPGLSVEMHFLNLIPSMILMCALASFSIWMACRKILKESALSAMRPPAEKSGKKLLLEHAKGIWDSLKMDTRLVLRNIFGNKRRTFLSAVGIASSMALVITGIGLKDAVVDLIDLQYSAILKCDVRVNLAAAVEEDDEMKDVDPEDVRIPDGMSVMKSASVLCQVKDKQLDEDYYTQVVTFDRRNTSSYYGILNLEGENIKIPKDGVLISQKMADKMGYKKGDKIKLKTIGAEQDPVTFTVKVAGISKQYYTQEVYCTPSYLEDRDIEAPMRNFYVKYDSDRYTEKQAVKKFQKMPEVQSVKSITDLEDDLNQYCEGIYLDTIALALIAMLISFAVIASISAINYTERLRTLALMKMMGHSNRKIFGLFIRENLFVTILGALAGVPAGVGLLYYVLMAESTDLCAFPFPAVTGNIIISCLLLVLFTLAANLTVWGKIKRQDIIRQMKVVE